jgi:hypothetical protein
MWATLTKQWNERQQTWRHAQNVVFLRVLYKFVNLISTLVICLKFVFIEMLDKLITYIVCLYKTLYHHTMYVMGIYLGCVLTWKYLKQGFWGKVLAFGWRFSPKTLASNISMLEPIQDNDNYKPHAKHYSNLSMFTEVIA